jgi:UPF0755 protein
VARGNRSGPAHERTAEERERDRLERELRRAGRSAPEPAADQPPPPPLPAVPVEPVAAAEPSEPPHDPPADAPAPSPPADREPVGAAPEDSPVADPLGAEPDELLLQDAAAAPHAAEPGELPAWEVAGDPIEPIDQIERRPRVARAEPLQQRSDPSAGDRSRGVRLFARGGGGGRDGRGRLRARTGGGGGRLTRARGAALLALAAAIVLVWFLLSLFQPFAGSGSGSVIVAIPKGSSSSKVGSILARDGVVSSGFFFDVRALLAGKRSSLHSGRFQLEHDMSYSAAIDALSKPPPQAIAVKVVIPEGYTRRQIAELVREDALTGDYLQATKRSQLISPAHYGASRRTPDLEGFLFPATYELTAGAPVTRLVNEQLTAFRQRFSTTDIRRARELGVTPYQLLTVASMIEREAQTEHDRPRIAAVVYNRLREGIPLGIDATIYYAVEQQKGIATYTGELTESQLKIDSPYNTRTHKGLPPTPISNPGLASIEAAAHPSHVPYLYYVAGADGCGEQVFSRTYTEFQKNAAAYDAAVKKNGGRPPSCKKK